MKICQFSGKKCVIVDVHTNICYVGFRLQLVVQHAVGLFVLPGKIFELNYV